MALDVGLLFTAVGLAKSVVEFAGILDSMEAKIDRLVQSELGAGLRALDQAAQGGPEHQTLLREARGNLNKAVGLELGHRKAIALLGLALCHHWLGDKANSTRALEEILEIDPVTPVRIVTGMGRRQIQDANPFTLPSRLGQFARELRAKGSAKILDDMFYGHPIIKYGKLALSSRARKEYKRQLVLDAVNMNSEARATKDIQESVSRYIGKPVLWLQAIS